MKNNSIALRIFIALASAGGLVGSRAAAQSTEPPENSATNIIPQIIMDAVPLREAIRNLARQMGINFLLDPQITDSPGTVDNYIVPEPSVSFRWSNLSASEALRRVLKANRLKLVDNPGTTIVRIVPLERAVVPLTVEQVGTDTNAANAVIPLIVMDTVPLPDAIRNLARQLQLNATLDPALSARAGGRVLSQEVSLRFENVTPRQALVALLDNYGLALREDAAKRSARIILKPERKADPASNRGEN